MRRERPKRAEEFDAIRSAVPISVDHDLVDATGRNAWHGIGPFVPPLLASGGPDGSAGFSFFDARQSAPAVAVIIEKEIDWKNREARLSECQRQPHDTSLRFAPIQALK
jgi:hypothetical protein